jgi:N-acetylmuramate 1-kinase
MANEPALNLETQAASPAEDAMVSGRFLPRSVWSIDLPTEADTVALARLIASEVRPGDLVTLSGELGAGKTTFARAVIRTIAGDPGLEVPSPTFTLMQTYETPAYTIVHADLYRVNKVDELDELGWEEAAEGALVLVEWPERAGANLAPDRLDIDFHVSLESRDGHRVAVLTGHGSFAQRLEIARAVRSVLTSTGWMAATRMHLQGDASTRAYERLTQPNSTSAILMIAPRRPDGPAIRRGKPYSVIAKLAESVHPFVAMAKGLRTLGLSAPEIIAADLDTGILLIEDLGAEPIVDTNGPMADRYEVAAAVLARLHAADLPANLPVAPGQTHTLPAYDLEALMIEAELVLDWYASHVARGPLPAVARAHFAAAWAEPVAEIVAAPTTWTLRDYHSPNLLWLPRRAGLARIGLLDFQDAVLGHPAYDLVSLLQDARVTVPPALELKLLGAYARARRAADAGFDLDAFARAYAILGAQRATKIIGIFARLDRRDHKPQYLKHLPRVEAYLARNLAHPVLSSLKLWYETHLPTVLSAG